MRIFCDTNIIMEFLQQRNQAELVGQVLSYASSRGDDLLISYGSFYTITYLIEGYLKRDKHLSGDEKLSELREILSGILDSFQLANSREIDIKYGVNDATFRDLEDSYQAHIAEGNGCDVLLTINKKHFEGFSSLSAMAILNPSEYIDSYIAHPSITL